MEGSLKTKLRRTNYTRMLGAQRIIDQEDIEPVWPFVVEFAEKMQKFNKLAMNFAQIQEKPV